MLVLARKVNESIIIGDSIIITVLAVDGDNIKMGITAPRDVSIMRQEVFQAVCDQEKIQKLLAYDAKTERFDLLRNLLADESNKNSTESEDPGAE